MRSSVTLFLLIYSVFSSCIGDSSEVRSRTFGSGIDTTGAVGVSEFILSPAGNTGKSCRLKGRIVEISQSGGGWFSLDNPIGSPVLVHLEDKNLSLPKEIKGQYVFLEGTAAIDTLSVEVLRRNAYDAGKSNAEIQTILEPRTEIVIEAKGIIIFPRDFAR